MKSDVKLRVGDCVGLAESLSSRLILQKFLTTRISIMFVLVDPFWMKNLCFTK